MVIHTLQHLFSYCSISQKRHQEIAATTKPTEAIQQATKESGGELEATGFQKLPRNIDQLRIIDVVVNQRMEMYNAASCYSAN